MKPIVKVCGMREPDNIRELTKLPIEYIGAIFYPKSPRYVGNRADTAEAFKTVTEQKVVGVFVNASAEEIALAKEEFSLSVAQLHGAESPAFCKEVSEQCSVFKAFGIKEDFDFSQLEEYEESVELFIFDTSCKEHGGSGKKFNWDLLQNYEGTTPFLLSGGIGPADLEKVLKVNHPQLAGVDLNSGFEIAPAHKDVEKLSLFIEEYIDKKSINA